MILLGIETSCDETALSLIEVKGTKENPSFSVLGNELISQIKIHEEYGGVFPMLAKREHGKNLVPLFMKLLKKSKIGADQEKNALFKIKTDMPAFKLKNLETILEREQELKKHFFGVLFSVEKPPIDAVAVTHGPGLEPALWVGINFAKVLQELWDIPIVPVNHMEGHIISALIKKDGANESKFKIEDIRFPALALLISGGHTELILMKERDNYKIIGKTKDDAVGEAFDKVARMLGLPYPGGPSISLLAEKERKDKKTKASEITREQIIRLPRPMIHSKDFDFSFSGLKTAVLYMIKKIPDLTIDIKQQIAKEFEDAVTEVLITKVEKAMEAYGIETLIAGGGVVANNHIRKSLIELGDTVSIPLYLPTKELSTDNALMIAVVGALQYLNNNKLKNHAISADGNLSF